MTAEVQICAVQNRPDNRMDLQISFARSRCEARGLRSSIEDLSAGRTLNDATPERVQRVPEKRDVETLQATQGQVKNYTMRNLFIHLPDSASSFVLPLAVVIGGVERHAMALL